jgi:hypothetical protein
MITFHIVDPALSALNVTIRMEGYDVTFVQNEIVYLVVIGGVIPLA